MNQHPRGKKTARYEDLFISFSVKVEKWVVRMALTLLVMLLFSQSLLQLPFLRHYLVKVEQLEGVPFERSAAF